MSNFGRQNQQQFNNQQQMSNTFNANQQNGQFRSNISSGSQNNDWDQFFQQSALPSGNNINSGNNVRMGYGGNGGMNQLSGSGGVQQQHQYVNDMAASQLLRNTNPQMQQHGGMPSRQQMGGGGGMSLDQSMKQALARTVGMSMSADNGGGGGNYQQIQQHQDNSAVRGFNSNLGGRDGGFQQEQQFRQMNDVRGNMSQNVHLSDMQQPQSRSYNTQPQNSGGLQRGGVGQMNAAYDSLDDGGDQYRGGGNGYSDRYQDRGGRYEEPVNIGSNYGAGNEGRFSVGAADPLSVLNKLNSIVAVTGGGLSAAQLHRAKQNPSGAKTAMASSGLQQPMRNFHANARGAPSGSSNMLAPAHGGIMGGGGFSNSGPPAAKRAHVEVLPGDVRYRGPAAASGSVGGMGMVVNARQQQMLPPQQVMGGGGFVSNKAQQQAWQQQQQQQQRGGDFNRGPSTAASLSSHHQTSFTSSTGSARGGITYSGTANQQSAGRRSKWSANPEDPLTFSGPPSAAPQQHSAAPRRIAKGGFPGAPPAVAHIANLNNLSFSGVSGSKRDRSPSPSYSLRSRSRSPSYRGRDGYDGGRGGGDRYGSIPRGRGDGGGRGGRGVSGGGRGDKRGSTRSPPRGTYNRNASMSPQAGNHQASFGGRTAVRDVEFSALLPCEITDRFNAPAIPHTMHTVATTDLYSRFPNLYVPADFVSLAVDWQSIAASLFNDKIAELPTSVPLLFENISATLTAVKETGDAATATSATTQGDGSDSKEAIAARVSPPSGLEVPRYTYLSADTVNNALLGSDPFAHYSTFHVATPRPVKFNARVIVSCGVANHETERIDHHLPRKLRVMCGRRKGQLQLLGTSWCQELDGGNPLEDRSCLLNTARRAVYAQSLLDIFNSPRESAGGEAADQDPLDVTSNLTKLCEVNYHRPREELHGRLYPEQEEVTAIYLYTLQPDSLPATEEAARSAWELFSSRAEGRLVGPVLNMNVDEYHDSAEYLDAVNTGRDADRVAQTGEEVSGVSEQSGEQMDATPAQIEEQTPAVPDGAASDNVSSAVLIEMAAVPEVGENAVEITVDRTGSLASAADDTAAGMKNSPLKEAVSIPSEAPVAVSAIPAVVAKQLSKPSEPTIFLCPTPLPKEVHEDNVRRQEAVSLRMLPLSAVLSYSLDDCSERIFEASVAAEFVRSLLATSSANIVVDFLIAEHPALSCLADVRVVQAVKVLRKTLEAAKAKAQAPVPAVPTTVGIVPAIELPTTTATESTMAVSDDTTQMEEADKTEEDPATGATVPEAANAVGEVASAEESATIPMEEQQVEGADSTAGPETAVVEAPLAEEVSQQQDHSLQQQEQHEQHEVDKESAPEEEEDSHQMREDEARMWRRRFLAACRWFDPQQERALSREVVELVLHSSTRSMSRADVASAADSVCKLGGGRVNYETFI